ncbi:hypothetical protein [Paenibacillus sp. FSL M7-1046]|uniref:hypothetical protein n=1 Tax=Paenibacillus sp. FSL M7-1046 TaxID=2975315 RepID=UPI0030F59315
MRGQESVRGERKTNKLSSKEHLLIDGLLMAENWGDNQGKWVPAIKQAIAMGEIEKLLELRAKFPYSFENSLKHLKKEEREVIRHKCELDWSNNGDSANSGGNESK